MTRLSFCRGPSPAPEPWADRWPCTAVLVSVMVLTLFLGAGLAVCAWLDLYTTRAPAARPEQEAKP